jgi:death-on-curing protein
VPPRWTPTLDDFIDAASFILGIERAAVERLPRLPLAESALHAPFASFGGTEAYPTTIEQAAVLLRHLAQNHPLPDGNKRVAFLLMARFLDANGLSWGAADPDTDTTMVERIASSAATYDETVAWIRARAAGSVS